MPALSYRRPAILKEIPLDRHTVIEANAGTGKTYAIQYLVLELLLNTDCSIEEILVVTFTEKATEELRSRIRALLESVLSGATATNNDSAALDLVTIDDAGKRKLQAALFAFDRAPICTIHAFCRRILNDLAFDSGAPFGLEVVDAQRVFHRAFRDVLREVFATGSSTRALLDEWMTNGETAGYTNLVDSLEDLLRNAHFNRYAQSDAGERNQRALDELAATLNVDLLKKLCARKNRRAPAEALAAADDLAAIVRRYRDSPRRLLWGALSAFDFDALRYRTSAEHDGESRLIEALGAARAACSLDIRIVDTFLPLVEERLLADKRRNGEVDYGDMLEWVSDALHATRETSLASVLRNRFRYGLVDEFQDTDDLQWKIFRKIFLESETANILYVVGDPKQAIYAFRGADVFTYLDASREILQSAGVRVMLLENHRSTGDYIFALNHILDQNAAAALFSGDIRYDQPVKCGRPHLRASGVEGGSIVPITLLRYCPGSLPGSAAKMRAAIGRYIAREIRDLLFNPAAALAIHDQGGSRPVGAKDIYILTRTGTEAIEVGGYLREHGVPFAFYKKEGLFQTREAHDILDVLHAIAEPDSQSMRLKAWISPFFAVPYQDLFDCDEPSAGDGLIERLYEWKRLAEQQRFDTLFDQLLHRSGLVSRELFLSNSERELTNYLHILELLLERAQRESFSLAEIITCLESFISGTALPAAIDSNIQRIESDRSAVQIMSVHMSKGLQADVVFLFGGTASPPMPPRLAVYHDEQFHRRIAVGKAGRAAALAAIEREACEDNQRLAYVASTRARAKVYLPVYPERSTKRAVNGYYEPLNNRLKIVSREIDRGLVPANFFEQIDIESSALDDAESIQARVEAKLATWAIPASLPTRIEEQRPPRLFEHLLTRSRAMQTRSYTSLGGAVLRHLVADAVEAEEFKYDLDTSDAQSDLQGGRRVGIFLHEVIEKLEMHSFDAAPDGLRWRERADIRGLFEDGMRRHQITDPRWFERGAEVIFNTLTSRILISDGTRIGPLYQCRSMRELEFTYPIPERTHRLLQSGGPREWTVERGYLKGFVDFVFEHAGMYYFADWKSDSLPSYDRASLIPHVNEHYDLQARIYSVGIVRLLNISSEIEYEQRFGGLLYLFLRGVTRDGANGDGVYFRRPSWNEICHYERNLIGAIAETAMP